MSATAFCAAADVASVDSVAAVNSRISDHESMMWRMSMLSYENPAVKQWMLPISYSTLSALYSNSEQSAAIDCRLGEGVRYFGIEADSYIKHKSSTLWGTAAYRNGVRESVVWNESSDATLIYPYFTADSIGGDLKGETYAFSGGYADHTDRWSWGATLSYTAGQYYRNVDPRPRNITGRLDIAAGGAWRIGPSDYQLAASVNFRKYKQSCDIRFVNELADTRIWHLTGLGTHYQRFAGSSYSHYYDGNRWGASLDLFPSDHRGAVFSAAYSRFKFDHILSSINKLPLASAKENRLRLTAGWLAPGNRHDWAATVDATITKRIGTENIFGDAAANVYPQIGSADMYTHSLVRVDISGLWQWRTDQTSTLAIKPQINLNRSRESYAEPHRHMLITGLTPAIETSFNKGFGRWWRAGVKASYSHTCIVDSDLDLELSPTDPDGMQTLETGRFGIMSKTSHRYSVEVNASRAISSKYALQLSAAFSRASYASGIGDRKFDIVMSFIF